MRNGSSLTVLVILFTVNLLTSCAGDPDHRIVTDLSMQKWHLWLEKNAEWKDDSLYLPPVNLSSIPVHEPGIGWNKLHQTGKSVTVPSTVEEYFWGWNGEPYGVDGDYTGVSWFSTEFDLPDSYQGKKVLLRFESVRFRAEVFVNEKLAGYDLIQGTPFTLDITPFIHAGDKNHLNVRITDPGGNFTWIDTRCFRWGENEIPPSHGFGGITGKVELIAVDSVHVEDVFIKNKPGIHSVDVQVTLRNLTHNPARGELSWVLSTAKDPGNEIISGSWEGTARPGRNELTQTIDYPGALPWSPDHPNLYVLNLRWEDENGHRDNVSRRFGFRWFEVRDENGDRQFFLNNKRIVLRTAISWGFWPVNGIYPTAMQAEKQIRTAREIGLNMLNFHRAIGQPVVLDKADELGLLYYEEPGGYATGSTEFTRRWQKIRLGRMVRRDRNHPSLIIYNMRNEPGRDPDSTEFADLRDIHRIDETRYKTWASNYFPASFHGGNAPLSPSPCKLFAEPYNHKLLNQGWWDEHHAEGPGCYSDGLYRSPDDYYCNTTHQEEIIFLGEEGAIGTPGRFEKIARDIRANDQKGWEGDDYLALYQLYDRFLEDHHFRQAFPSVDDLTLSMGNVAYYYQGRIIENARINNITDGYAVNGWEENKLENHSGIVDVYRNPKGDPTLISRYCKPLFLAVKVRTKVMASGDSTVADVFIVNEEDLHGSFILEVRAGTEANTFFRRQYNVEVSGGNTYGELLKRDIIIRIPVSGYTEITAVLKNDQDSVSAEGSDEVFAVDPFREIRDFNVSVFDTSGFVRTYLSSYGLDSPEEYHGYGLPSNSVLITGMAVPKEQYGVRQELLDWVSAGNTLIIIGNSPLWLDYLSRKEVAQYLGSRELGKVWYGGNHFVKEQPFFRDLPVNTAFNWEYQCFADYRRDRRGLRVHNGEIIVAAVSDHQKEVYSALGIIPLGRGQIIYSSLDFAGALESGKGPSMVAKRLLYNMIKESEKVHYPE